MAAYNHAMLWGVFRATPPMPVTGALERAGGLRPAQAGIALTGSVRPALIAATLVDLHHRGFIDIDEADDGKARDWILTRTAQRQPARPLADSPGSADVLLYYEKTLLHGLFGHQRQVRLSGLASTGGAARAVSRVYRQLDRQAARRGWLKARQDPQDPLFRTLRAFRQDLRRLTPAGPGQWAAGHEYLPYAIAFGVASQWAEQLAGLEPLRGGVNGVNLSGFWVSACTHIDSAVPAASREHAARHSGATSHLGVPAGHHGGSDGGHQGGDYGGHHGGSGGHGGFGGHF
jgi:hypothetical protein